MSSTTFGGSIKLEGEQSYRAAVSQINSELKVLASEMGKVTAEFGKSDKSTEGLTARNKVLADQIDKQKNKIEQLKGALADSSEKYGENDKKTLGWQTSLNKAEAELIKMEKELDGNNQALNDSEKATDEAAGGVKDFGEATDEAGEKTLKFGDIVKASLLADAIKAGLKALGNAVKEVGDYMTGAITSASSYGREIDLMSQKTGLSTESIQKFKAASKTTGVDIETFTGALAKSVKSMNSASSGTGAAAQAYAKLGISVKDSSGNLKDNEQMFWEAADALKNMSNETERDAIAMQIFGKSAQELNPIIKMGSEGFNELTGNMATFDEATIKSLSDVDVQFQKFAGGMDGIQRTIGAAFAPMVLDITKGANDIVGSFRNIIMTFVNEGDVQGAIDKFVGSIQNIVPKIQEMLPKLLETASSLINVLVEGISQAIPTLVETVSQIIPQLVTTIMNSVNTLIPLAMQIIMALVNGIIAALPALISGATQMIGAIVSGISQALPVLVPAVISVVMAIVNGLLENLPMLLDAGITLLLALVDAIPPTIDALLDALPGLIDSLINALIGSIDKLLDGAIKLFMAIVNAIPVIMEKLMPKIPEIIFKVIDALVKLIPELMKGAQKLFMALVDAIPTIISAGLRNLAAVWNAIWKYISEWPSKMWSAGEDLVKGIWNGISNMVQWIKDKIFSFAKTVTDSIKNFFGIHSPSTLFRDDIGKNLALGLGEGFSDEMNTVAKDMQNAIPTNFDLAVNSNVNDDLTGFSVQNAEPQVLSLTDTMISAFQRALQGMAFQIDDEKMGEMVINKVSRVVFS